MLRQVAVTTTGRIAAAGLGTVPGEKVLILVERTTKSAPVVPIFLSSINDISLIIAAKVEALEIFLGQAAGDIVLRMDTTLQVAFIRAHKTHHVESTAISKLFWRPVN